MRSQATSASALVVSRGALALVFALIAPATACDCGGGVPMGDGGAADASTVEVPVDAGLVDGGGDASDAGGEPPPTLEQLATELCRAYARGLVNLERHRALESPPARCSNDDPAPDIDDEEPLPVGTCGVQDPLREVFVRALSGGRVAIDLDAFRACQAKGRAVRAATPTLGDVDERLLGIEALAADPECQAAITPLVSEEQAPCVQAWDCAPPLACEADPLDSFSLKCLAPAVEGARCDEAPPSDEVLPLRTCAAELACVLGVCTARLAVDAACTDDGVPCAEGLTCRSSGSCGAPSDESGPCSDDGDCREGLACDGATSSCVTPAPPTADGEPCTTNAECASLCSVCRPLDDADAGTACQDRGAAGDACTSYNHCRAGLFCDGSTQTCAPYRALGEECGAGSPCVPGLVCTDTPPPVAPDGGVPEPVTDAGVVGPYCQERRSLGEGCERFGTWRCEEGLFCVDGACRAGTFGDPCYSNAACQEGALCVNAVCERAPRLGAPCTSDGRCAEGLRCDGERCVEYPPAGEACTPDRRCGEGAFCPEGSSTCETLRPPGQACTSDGECRTGVCLDTLTCGGDGASCLTTERAFAQLVGLALVLPLLSLARRRRRR